MFVEGEQIIDVTVVDDHIPVKALLEKYSDWQPQDFERFYISPGVIDANVRQDWETSITMTKAAVSGGVTAIVVEPGIYVPNTQLWSMLYCDTYHVTVVNDNSLSKVAECRRTGAIAAKAYLYPPSCSISQVYDLPALYQQSMLHNVPVIVDAFFPDSDRLFSASAFHHANIEGRDEIQLSLDPSFGGAYHYCNSSSSDEEIDISFPERRITRGASILLYPISATSSNSSITQLPDIKPEPGYLGKARSNSLVTSAQPVLSEVVKPRGDIYTDLERRIKRNQTNYADLAKIESSSYNTVKAKQSFEDNCAKTIVRTSAEILSRKSSGSTSPPSKLRRPPGLKMLRKPSNVETQAMNYLKFLVNCPDNWENEGVKRALQTYKAFPCKLHFSNISSAAAINKVRKLKSTYPDLTCETCPQYLYFTDATVPPCDTRYKAFPPIRNQNNNNLLWELLKVKAIDMIASNHTSVRPDLKFLTDGDFKKAATGFSSLGFAMQAVWTKLKSQIQDPRLLDLYIVRLSKWFSFAPAKLLGIEQSRGSISKGNLADLLVWSPFESVVSEVSHSAFGDTSPFAGMELSGRIERVYVRGRIAFTAGQFKAVGKRLQKSYS